MSKKNSREKKRDREIALYKATLVRIKKWRSVALFLGLVPFAGLTACDVGLAFACIQREIYLGMWAAIVGAVVGLSIRLVLERRRFQQRTPSG
jgi:membrane associated rhomboid family serine protease